MSSKPRGTATLHFINSKLGISAKLLTVTQSECTPHVNFYQNHLENQLQYHSMLNFI